MNQERFRSRTRACLTGVAIGDAMGMSVEGMVSARIRELDEGRGVTGFLPRIGPDFIPTKGLRAGDTTDDWQLTQAVARSLVRTKGTLDLRDCAEEHIRELDTTQIGWGLTTAEAIRDLKDGKRNPVCDPLPPPKPNTGSGNGVMMKIAPVAIVHALRGSSWEALWHDCRALGSLTHADIRASITAFAVAYAMRQMLVADAPPRGLEFLREILSRVRDVDDLEALETDRVSDQIAKVEPVFDNVTDLRLIKGFTRFHSMYTVTITLGTFMRHPADFRAGVLEIVSQGGDTDSNASILGALIGSVVGMEGIPPEWVGFSPAFASASGLADQLIDASL